MKDLWKTSATSLNSTRPDAQIIRIDLSKCNLFQANWHHSLNQMCERCTILYGSFLQSVHIMLGINRMEVDLTKSFQLSWHLHKITHNVSERLLYYLFLTTHTYEHLMKNIPTPENFKKWLVLHNRVYAPSVIASLLIIVYCLKSSWLTSKMVLMNIQDN